MDVEAAVDEAAAAASTVDLDTMALAAPPGAAAAAAAAAPSPPTDGAAGLGGVTGDSADDGGGMPPAQAAALTVATGRAARAAADGAAGTGDRQPVDAGVGVEGALNVAAASRRGDADGDGVLRLEDMLPRLAPRRGGDRLAANGPGQPRGADAHLPTAQAAAARLGRRVDGGARAARGGDARGGRDGGGD